MKTTILASLLFLTSLNAYAIRHLSPEEIPKDWKEIKKLDFKRYGDHLFGYATAQEASNGKKFLEIRFSNGTKTKYSFGVNIRCINKDGKTSEYFYERTAGHTGGFGGAVEKSGEIDLQGCTRDSIQFGWALSKKDLISLDDVINYGKIIALQEIFGEIEWN